ncbi:MAG: glycerophosphodiester phosphodiesterase [Chloroflexi bacterium]|nr:glycerophosphodiester phosphodiesterase [Chloroflexota bacterium]
MGRLRLRARNGQPLVIAHRGASGERPENTLAAFDRAADLGAPWVELDVQLTRDDQPVVVHDPTLDRTTDGRGRVRDHTFAELERLDAGRWFASAYAGERIPTLAAVLAWARRRGIRVDVEIKNGPIFYEGIVERVLATITATGTADQVLVTSFDHHAIAHLRQLDATIATGLLYAARPLDPVDLARRAGADVVLPQCAYVVADDIRAVHAANLGFATWATSDPALLARLANLGVDAVATDHPTRGQSASPTMVQPA